MANWRRQRGRNHHNQPEITQQQQQQQIWTRSSSSKPPIAKWERSVPAWEKNFCRTVGSVPWRKVLEAKKNMYIYDNVIQWNDSAGEEAFNNAKSRFWAKINDLPCNISLPDPDIYIDDVDWDAKVDNELILDLDRDPEPPQTQTTEGEQVILGMSVLSDHYTVGWGEAEGIDESNCTARKAEQCDWNGGSWEQNNEIWNGKGKMDWCDHTKSTFQWKNTIRGDWNQGEWCKSWRVYKEDNVEDCRRRNRRGRSRGCFRHHSNGRVWTETF